MQGVQQFFAVHKREIMLSTAASFFLIIVSMGMFIKTSEAILPVGGRILYTWYCTCSGGVAAVLGPPTPGLYTIFQLGATIPYTAYELYRPGPVILGSAYPSGACYWYVPPAECVGFETEGTLNQVGTSVE